VTLVEDRPIRKFSDPRVTAKGEERAWVDLTALETLWFNTGTLCNIACDHCYIESSPRNDRLVYLTLADVKFYLDEIARDSLPVSLIGFTGGEPFMNPAMFPILEETLARGFETCACECRLMIREPTFTTPSAAPADSRKRLQGCAGLQRAVSPWKSRDASSRTNRKRCCESTSKRSLTRMGFL
jgi:hypothetical protein